MRVSPAREEQRAYVTCRATPPACGPSCIWIGEEPGSSHTARPCSSPAATPARGGPQPPRAFSGLPEPARGAWLGSAPAIADRSAARSPRRSNGDSCRSEEHTSELQSPCNLVCRLLLEKKKNT